MENKQTLLCWQSVNHGDEVLLNTIKLLNKRGIELSRIILLKQDNLPSAALPETGISIEETPISLSDPTDHRDIYSALLTDVLPKIKDNRHLHINISPGTPAMHAVWLILHAGGRFPGGTKLWSSQYNPETKRNSIKEIDFPINTYLSEIIALQKTLPNLAVYDVEAKSPLRRTALEDIKRFSMLHDIPLLISGERGTGKSRLVETLIKTVKQKEVVTLVCSELNADHADSLLFGEISGREGILKTANNNVLFLDEIQDLPLSFQRRLLRVLQDKQHKFRQIGSDEESETTFDLVCSTNLPITELKDVLDKDFFDRISMLNATLPPLRECREDLLHDWQRVWSELQMPSFPQTAPMTDGLRHFLENTALVDNFRDLQKLACLVMAYWQENNPEHGVETALQIFSPSHTPIYATNNALILTGVTRLELLNRFKKEIAVNAKNMYGTWRKAAAALDCDEKTLRQDAEL